MPASRLAALGALLLLPACSATSPAPQSADGKASGARSGDQQTWRQPSNFDADGPPGGGVYRGGRDPITGKAQEWAPGGPVETSSLPAQPIGPAGQGVGAPLPPPAPANPGLGLQGLAIVRPGDTLQSIARAHGVPVAAIMQANHMKSQSVRVGQRLVIPQ